MSEHLYRMEPFGRWVKVEPDYEAATEVLHRYEGAAGTAPLRDDDTNAKWAKAIVDAAYGVNE